MPRKKIFIKDREELELKAEKLRDALSKVSGSYSTIANRLLFEDNIPLKRMYQRVYRIFHRQIITDDRFTLLVMKYAEDLIKERSYALNQIIKAEQKSKKCN